MKNLVRNTFASILLVSGSLSMAGDFDGSKTLICAPVVAMNCVVDQGCTRGTPDEVGAPAFMRIDFEKKLVVGPKKVTPILIMDKNDQQVLLQGNELGFGWTIVVEANDGRLISSIINHNSAFLLYGACTPL
jgi:hypothetical protein